MSPTEIPEHLEFQDRGEPATEEQIEAAEKALGRNIPADYREFLRAHNGARVEPPNFRIPVDSDDGPRASVSWWLGVGLQDSLDIAAIATMYEGRMPAELLPIARDPGGNLIAMDPKGRVHFWDHEFEEEEDDDGDDGNDEPTWDNVSLVASDLRSLLEGLAEQP
jgi:hypothetical protein